MSEKEPQIPKITPKSTKQEMLDSYNMLLKQLEDKSQENLKPSEKMEEKKVKEVIETANKISTEGVVKKTTDLKYEFGVTLSKLSEELESQIAQYQIIKTAVENKRKELQEIFEIEKEASSLAALIEAQNQKRETFEAEMALRKEKLEAEIQNIKDEWDKSRKLREQELKEQDSMEAKRRKQEKEDFEYNFQREKQQIKDKFEAEKSAWEREWENSKESKEKALAEREKSITDSETELKELREKVKLFPQEMEKAIDKAVKEATKSIILENQHKGELSLKVQEGEEKVYLIRIESLEKTIKEQSQQIAKLSTQLENSYHQVQDIAVKAVSGSSGQLNLTGLKEMLKEQSRKTESGKNE